MQSQTAVSASLDLDRQCSVAPGVDQQLLLSNLPAATGFVFVFVFLLN